MPSPWVPASLPGYRTWNLIQTVVQLVGASSGSATSSGALGNSFSMAGSSSGSATSSATLGLAVPLEGSASGSASASGIFGLAVGLQAVTDASADASGDLGTFRYVYIEASSTGSASASGQLSLAIPVQGSSTGSADSSASLRVNAGLVGSADGSATATGLIGFILGLYGSAEGAAMAHGQLGAVRLGLQGTSTGSASASGRLSTTRGPDFPEYAIELVFNQPSVSVLSSNLSIEAGEPGAGLRSAWWHWRPSITRIADFDGRRTSLVAGSGDPNWVLEVYTGTPFEGLVLVGSTTPATGYVRLDVLPGRDYWVRMAQLDSQELSYNVWVHEKPVTVPDVVPPVLVASGTTTRNNGARAVFL